MERVVLNSTQVTTAEPTTGDKRNQKHAYPDDLARFVREHWEDSSRDAEGAKDERDDSLPVAPVLEALLSTCYQASLLREEERPVTFRLIFANPDFSRRRKVPRRGCTGSSSASQDPSTSVSLDGSRQPRTSNAP
jgi:hypothetical protein